MKNFKLVLLAFLGILSVDSFAQLGHHVRTHTYQGSPRYASYSDYGQNSRIGFLANELYLSNRQARKLNDILRYYDREIDRVYRTRRISNRARRAALRNLRSDRDYDVQSILSRRQYSKYLQIRNWEANRRNGFSCSAHGGSCSSGACYNNYYDNRWNDGWDHYWNGNRRDNWERNNRQDNRNDRYRDRNDDYYDDRNDDRWDDRRGSTNDRKNRDDRYESDDDWYPSGRASEKKDASTRADENVKYTDTTESSGNGDPIIEEERVVEVEQDEPRTDEEQMDDYFEDEIDYGDDEELDDYFADEGL